jgi:hypothetical protein
MVFVRKIEVTTDGVLNTGLRITKTVLARSELSPQNSGGELKFRAANTIRTDLPHLGLHIEADGLREWLAGD